MKEFDQRMMRCFATVFPDLDESAIRRAAMGVTDGWDSVATVTLINVVEEEFGIEVDLDAVEEMVSFDKFSEYLRSIHSAQ
jgi:acyl carrier protein